MKTVKKMKLKKHGGLLALVSVCAAVALTFSFSSAKHAVRHEYKLKLAMAEHFTFSPGNSYNFEIPYDGYYAFKLWGGAGGNSRNSWWDGQEIYQLGGEGGEVAAVSYFTKGTVLTITVGTRGGTTGGGFNGGGDGGDYYFSSLFNDYYGGGGGGATDVRLSSGTLSDRILVAGGGGGGSGGGSGYSPGRGGNGGTAYSGFIGAMGAGAGAGEGGTLYDGGLGYQYGAFGYGGNATYSGGGGGGGYYGGGGAYGSGGGGGGGSSYIADSFTVGVPEGLPGMNDYPVDSGDGYAIVSFLGSRYMTSAAPDEGAPPHYDETIPSAPEEQDSENIDLITEPEADPDVTPEPEPEPEPTPDPEPDPSPDPEPEPAPDPSPESDLEIAPEPAPGPESDPETTPDF